MPSLQNSLCGRVSRDEHELQPLSRKLPGKQKKQRGMGGRGRGEGRGERDGSNILTELGLDERQGVEYQMWKGTIMYPRLALNFRSSYLHQGCQGL